MKQKCTFRKHFFIFWYQKKDATKRSKNNFLVKSVIDQASIHVDQWSRIFRRAKDMILKIWDLLEIVRK